MQYTFHFHSNGSLLLTGEYLVSKGSQAIVLPLKKGQTLVVKPIKEDLLIWESIYNQETSFKAVFSTGPIDTIESTDGEEAFFVRHVLKKAMEHLASLSSLPGHSIQAMHNYSACLDPGSRAALIASIAVWFNINPFRLNREVMKDTGCGIAGARSAKPILYKVVDATPDYKQIDMDPPFTENLYFVYTGAKTDFSDQREKIERFGDLSKIFSKISEINKQIIQSDSLEEFEQALLEHEQLLTGVLNERRIQEREFSDFSGVIKPLTMRNSEFLLVTWKGGRDELREYFARYDLPTIFLWDELIKNEK